MADHKFDPSKYKTCSETGYCRRNRFIEKQNWRLDQSSIQIEPEMFTATVHTPKDDLTLSISISDSFFRVKLSELNEHFIRYDCAQVACPNFYPQEFEYQKRTSDEQTYHNLISGKYRIEISSDPFTINYYTNDNKIISINRDDNAIFETSQPAEEEKFRGVADNPIHGQTAVAMSFDFPEGTRFAGLPPHTLGVNLDDTYEPIRFFNTDIHSFIVGTGHSMYGAIPYLIGHSGENSATIFWCNPSETWVDLNSTNARFISETGYLDFFLTAGTHQEAVDSFTRLTGRPALPPRWSLGYHQCRWSYYSSSEVREVSQKLDAAGIPHDALWMDLDYTDDKQYFTFNSQYQDIKKLEQEFKEKGRHLVALLDPHLKASDHYSIYSEAKANGFLVTRDGSEFKGDCWPGRSAWVDFFNPDACQWWGEKVAAWSEEIDVWNDMNEPSVFGGPDGTFFRNVMHCGDIENREVHNLYGHLNAQSTYFGLINRLTPAGIPKRPFILTRSFFAGTQRYAFMWTGDNSGTYDMLRNSLQMHVSLGISGFPFVGSDVGGFFDSSDPELILRWYQAAAWTYPFFRCHCHHLVAHREPYQYTGDVFEGIKIAIQDRYKLLPMWYTAAHRASLTGQPLITPLWWWGGDVSIEDEVIVCDSLLVAPVMEEKCHSRKVTLPEGRWYEWSTLREHQSGDVTIRSKLNLQVPVFLKGGVIVPIKSRIKANSEQGNDPFILKIGLDSEGRAKGSLYLDDGISMVSESDEEASALIHYEFDGKTITADDCSVYNKEGSDAQVTRIEIAGIKQMPNSVVVDGRQLHFEELEAGVIAITKANVPVKGPWKIDLTYDSEL